jgi:hypothetical protein
MARSRQKTLRKVVKSRRSSKSLRGGKSRLSRVFPKRHRPSGGAYNAKQPLFTGDEPIGKGEYAINYNVLMGGKGGSPTPTKRKSARAKRALKR